MFNEIKKTIEWGHDKLTLETGKIARQADSTVIAVSYTHLTLPTICSV